MTKDELYIKRCFQLAKLGDHKVGPNPFVGAVIVYNDRIIGEGYHQQYGGNHAEVNAYKSIRKSDLPYLPESTIYVNLEPCFHYGKTPPCVDLILREKIKKVVISCKDPHPNVAGKSINRLQENGVEVIIGVLEKEGQFLARRFLTSLDKNRPYIILKYAQSEDGFIGQEGKQVWLTGSLSKRLVHQWRSKETAILIGTNTAEIDNPRLTNRLYSGGSPIRIVLDAKGRLPHHLHVFDGAAKTYFIAEKEIQHPNIKTILHDSKNESLSDLMSKLKEINIKSLIVEGGAQVLKSFIQENLWDEARIFKAAIFLKSGIKAPVLPKGEIYQKKKVGEDILHLIYPFKTY